MPELLPLYPVSRDHLDVLTGEFGIMQHAIGARPDPAHGSCVDDVARALRVDLLHGRQLGWPAVSVSAQRNVRFLDEAFDRITGRFRNFRSADGPWIDAVGSQDSHGRAMLALGETIAGAPDPSLVEFAATLFELALPAAEQLTAWRAMSSVALGCDAVVRSDRATIEAMAAATYGRLSGRLAGQFLGVAGSTDWPWPEPRLTYENALPVRALIAAGRHHGSPAMVDAGLRALDWLVRIQTHPDGHFSPIGNGWWGRNGVRSQFDQQPIEATTVILAAELAFAITDDDRFRSAAEMAYGWFLGRNDLGVPVAEPSRGAGHDGLTPTGVNTNQGAESTLMWLLALEHIREMRQTRRTPTRGGQTVPAVAS